MEELNKYLLNKFDEHEVKVLVNTPDVQVFRCRKPGTGIYGFQVVCSDNMISLNGDIGTLAITPGYGRGIGWLRGSINSVGYVVEKIPHTLRVREFDLDKAKETLREYLQEDWLSEENQKKLAEVIEDLHETGNYGMCKAYDAIAHIFDGEPPRLETMDHQVLFQIYGLQWLCKKLDEIEFKKGEESPNDDREAVEAAFGPHGQG